VRSARYRPLYRIAFWLFVATGVGLGYLGGKPAEAEYVLWSRVLTVYYFAHLIIVLPILGKLEKTLPLPQSIAEPVLKQSSTSKKA